MWLSESVKSYNSAMQRTMMSFLLYLSYRKKNIKKTFHIPPGQKAFSSLPLKGSLSLFPASLKPVELLSWTGILLLLLAGVCRANTERGLYKQFYPTEIYNNAFDISLTIYDEDFFFLLYCLIGKLLIGGKLCF